jgi:hypothetical protein
MPWEIGVFGDSAHVLRVRPDHIDGLGLDQVLEILAQVDFFSGVNGKWLCCLSPA